MMSKSCPLPPFRYLERYFFVDAHFWALLIFEPLHPVAIGIAVDDALVLILLDLLLLDEPCLLLADTLDQYGSGLILRVLRH